MDPLAHDATSKKRHLVDRVHVADVVPAFELGNVAIKVLVRNVMEGAVIPALEQAPQRLDAIRVHVTPDILVRAVIDTLMRPVDAFVRSGFIGVDRRRFLGAIFDKRLQRLGVRAANDCCAHLLGLAILHPGDNRLSSCPATNPGFLPCLPLLVRHVLDLAADGRFVGFNRAGERLVDAAHEAFANALHHEPRSRLTDADFAVELHARSALDAGSHHVEGDCPILKPDLAGLHRRSLADGEVGAAVLAAIRHGLAALDNRIPDGTAIRAVPFAVWPPLFFKPPLGGVVVREHFEKLDDGDSLPVRSSGCLVRHVIRLPYLESIVSLNRVRVKRFWQVKRINPQIKRDLIAEQTREGLARA